MNNLLRTLSESRAKAQFPEHDLKTLLSTVKDFRRQSQDAKLTDAFYDSLENMLHDLRTVTPDNHDAEAFLKPVLRAEVPDYYDVISNPMDLQTMLKKVKQRQYKSKREFKDDLDLIWSNCFAYNSSDNHPLRLCATRLKTKADKLLKHITDRKARVDPEIPSDLANPSATSSTYNRLSIKVNGHVNGHSKAGTPTIKVPGSNVGIARKLPPKPQLNSRSPSTVNHNHHHTGPIPFSETPALVRTQAGMSAFLDIDRALNPYFNASSSTTPTTPAEASSQVARFKELVPSMNDVEEEEGAETDFIKEENDESLGMAAIGNKRKLNGVDNHGRPRKRIRYTPAFRHPIPIDDDPVTSFWWGAAQSTYLSSNVLPHIPFPITSSLPQPPPPPPPPSIPPPDPTSSAPHEKPTPVKRKRRRKAATALPPDQREGSIASGEIAAESMHPRNYKNISRSMLGIMNNNIRTMKRVRHTHARFAALGLSGKDGEGEGGTGEAGGAAGVGGVGGGPPATTTKVEFEVPRLEEDVGLMDDRVDERPWMARLARSSRVAAAATDNENDNVEEEAIEIGEKNANDCLHWMGSKVLEHAGFQGSSKAALDVIAGVTSEYLMNVGRLIRYLTDKHGHSMSPEEIILHTLFESGVAQVGDLERYVRDDVERYGARIGDLEKKLVGAYRDAVSRLVLGVAGGSGDSQTAVDEDEEEGLFEAEDEEETGAFARGDFADAVDVDFFGFRAMGLAEEFGLSSLSIPSSLLGGKRRRLKVSAVVKKAEPPPPYPPPPPFVPLSSFQIDSQIGLLKGFYMAKAQALAVLPVPPPPPPLLPSLPPPPLPRPPLIAPLPGPSIPGLSNGVLPPPKSEMVLTTVPPPPPPAPTPPPSQPAVPIPVMMDILIPDDLPTPSQMKMGPLGQILKPSMGSLSTKKKVKTSSAGGGPSNSHSSLAKSEPPGSPLPPTQGGTSAAGTAPPPPKKKNSKTIMPGVGTGNGRKARKAMEAAKEAAEAQARSGGGQTPGASSEQTSPTKSHPPTPAPLPPVVVASA